MSNSETGWMKRQYRRLPITCLIVLVAIGVAGCGSSNSSNSTTGTSSGTASDSAFVATSEKLVTQAKEGFLTGPPAGYVAPESLKKLTSFEAPAPFSIAGKTKKHKVTVIRCEAAAICGRMGYVIASVLKKIGWEVKILDPTFSSTESEIQTFEGLFNQAIAEKPDVIVSLAVSAEIAGAQIEKAKKEGIKTVLVFAGKETGTGYDAYVPYAYNLQRELTAAYGVAASKGKGTFLNYGLEGAAQTWPGVVAKYLSGCSGCTVYPANIKTEACFSPVLLQQSVTADLQSHGKSEYMLWPSQGCLMSAAERAIATTGSSAKLVTTEAIPEGIQRMKNGKIAAIAWVPPEWTAFAGADVAIRAAEGQPLPAESEFKYGVGLWTPQNVPTGTTYPDLYEYALKIFNFAGPYAKAWGLPEAALNVPEEK